MEEVELVVLELTVSQLLACSLVYLLLARLLAPASCTLLVLCLCVLNLLPLAIMQRVAIVVSVALLLVAVAVAQTTTTTTNYPPPGACHMVFGSFSGSVDVDR